MAHPNRAKPIRARGTVNGRTFTVPLLLYTGVHVWGTSAVSRHGAYMMVLLRNGRPPVPPLLQTGPRGGGKLVQKGASRPPNAPRSTPTTGPTVLQTGVFCGPQVFQRDPQSALEAPRRALQGALWSAPGAPKSAPGAPRSALGGPGGAQKGAPGRSKERPRRSKERPRRSKERPQEPQPPQAVPSASQFQAPNPLQGSPPARVDEPGRGWEGARL
jgi:hypothetical protein